MPSHYKGRIYDAACGSGGIFVRSEKIVESHGGKPGYCRVSIADFLPGFAVGTK